MRVSLVALPLLLAACGSSNTAATNEAAGFEPPAVQPPKPLPGQAQTTPLSAYVGHYPKDAVDGVGFYDRTDVATALDGAVTDAAIRRVVVRAEGPQTPIFSHEGRIASWGCEAHNCGDHHWTLLVDPASGKGELCVWQNGRSLWHTGGPPVVRPGDCPSEPLIAGVS